MTFVPSIEEDIQLILSLYDAAIEHQKAVSDMHWLPFDQELVAQEIGEGRQWKILVDGQAACVFVVAYQDEAIWGVRDADPAVYLHRIVTHPAYRGRNFVGAILEWAKIHGKTLGKSFIRLDTWAENMKLKEIYERNGFQFLGVVTPIDLSALPSHYSGIRLSLFEVAI